MFLPMSWRWPTTQYCEMLRSPDTFQVLLVRFASTAWSTASKFTLTLPDSRGFYNPILLQSSGDCTVVNCTFTFRTINIFGSFGPVRTRKAYVPELDYVATFKSHSEWINAERVAALSYHDTTKYSGYLSWNSSWNNENTQISVVLPELGNQSRRRNTKWKACDLGSFFFYNRIYAEQTSTYLQNIAKVLPHSSLCQVLFLVNSFI